MGNWEGVPLANLFNSITLIAVFGFHKKYSKTCLERPLKKKLKLVFKTDYHLMQVKSIAECSKGSILQYF